MKKLLLTAFFITTISATTIAQQYASDVTSIDAIIKVLYDVISDEAGKERDWARFRNLFAKDARLMPTYKTAEGKFDYRILTPDEYAERTKSRGNPAFFEWELSRKTEEYGSIAHVFTTYATKQAKDGPITNRGINSIQLLKDNDRYYIISIFWCGEDSGFQLPDKYLGKN
ncbi:MAG TPA: hypothetical protein VK907_08095 [Phnomibacter sp.]|nr:hypothetical protein [Phnomibacter sp.]